MDEEEKSAVIQEDGSDERIKKAWKQPLDLVCQVDAAIYGSGGLARYAKAMVSGLVSYGQAPKLFWVEQATFAERKDPFKKELKRLIYVPLASRLAKDKRLNWLKPIVQKIEQFRIDSGVASLLGNSKLYWSMCHRIYDISGPKKIATVHDAIAALTDRYHTPDEIRDFSKFLSKARKYADLVFVPSEATKEDMVKRLKFPQDLIEILPSPLDPIFLNPPTKELPQLDINARYILSVGTLGVRKDIKGLFEAYNAFRKEVSEKVLLVLIGRTATTKRLRELCESSPFGQDVIHLGFVDDLKLVALYKNASLLCYPSLAEGFGYPVAEAMALGTPVVAYKLPSIEWVTENRAAKLVPVGDVKALTEAMLEVWHSKEISENMSKHGRLIAKRFAPRKIAMRAVKLIRERLLSGEG